MVHPGPEHPGQVGGEPPGLQHRLGGVGVVVVVEGVVVVEVLMVVVVVGIMVMSVMVVMVDQLCSCWSPCE